VSEEPPITVVGAGPCGSYAALTIARQHVPVVVLEEHDRIGLPPHCAGHVGMRGLSRIGVSIPADLIQTRIRGARFYSPSCRELLLDHGSPVTYVLDRPKFDRWLARQASRHGATYRLSSRVRSLTFKEGHPRLSIEALNRDFQALQSNLVIDAEGCPASLLKAARLQWTNSAKIVSGAQVEVDNANSVSEEFVELYFGREYAPGFFAWIIPKGYGSVKVGLAARERDPVRLLNKFVSQHPVASRKLRDCRMFNLTVHPVTLGGPILRTYTSGLLAVGDAASQVKPTTGGGIVTGLLCSRIAGEVGSEAWKHSNYTAEFLSTYQDQWRKLVWKDFLLMRRIREYLDAMSDEKMNRLFELAHRTGVMSDLGALDDIDFQASSLLSLVKYPRALARLLYLLFRTLDQ